MPAIAVLPSRAVVRDGWRFLRVTAASLICATYERNSSDAARLSDYLYKSYRQGQWREVQPYGGQLTEDVAALARELLVDRMFVLEAARYPIVFTVHDAIVVEHPDITKETLETIMSVPPSWAAQLGMPVRAKAWVREMIP